MIECWIKLTGWIPALAAALAGTLLLALVYYYLYARYRQRYLGVWSFAWSVYAFRFVAELIGALTGFSSGAAVASQSVTLFSSILLLSGTYGFLSKPLPRAWVAAGAVGMLWMLLAALLEARLPDPGDADRPCHRRWISLDGVGHPSLPDDSGHRQTSGRLGV